MDHFAGLDVSVKETSVCIVDHTGSIVREVKVVSKPEALLQVLGNPIYRFKRIGLICCGQIYVVSTEASQGRGISLGSLRNINGRTFRPTALSGRPSTTAESVVDMAGSCR
jgi:hypothetical protein